MNKTGTVPVTGRAAQGCRADGDEPAAGVASVANAVVELLRTVRRSKARLLAAASDDVDSATQILLRTAALEGPTRASTLAACVQSDLSTVSRQVTVLVTRGLLERQADPEDGRASLLVVTAAGRAVVAEHEQARMAFFEQVVSDWSPQERDQFAHLLERFTAAYDTTHIHWMTDAARQTATRSGNPEESDPA
ncbi:transcriptional regulator, MarR family [Actinacidiphila yanglinensis]|uniref:Transcriptional regulator, MarR family n=1 Tax=Actinacidiphila yanglinensis TaxID=310779 RepID=A0A1H6D6U3_9ACTN|nr:MarR family transcriptional regulator [Actinacidiphila yanglinensis]SEG80971.1 transcriptional regulator, MarR family [Actinacidiphila yanglinensis]